MLTIPDNKVVIVIPDFPNEEKPSSSVPDTGKSPSAETGKTPSDGTETNGSDKQETKPVVEDTAKPSTGGDSEDGKDTTPAVKELLTKGDDNTVPALPTLPPTEEGNLFEGWVDKATGEPVKKGDKLTDSIEIAPVWKDCGEDQHSDKNKDHSCDECGHKLPDTTETGDRTTDSTKQSEKEENSGVPLWVILIGSGAAGIFAVCTGVLLFANRKKK